MGTALSVCAGAMAVSPTFSCFTFRRKVIPIIQSPNLSLEESRDPWVQGPVGAAAEMEAHPQCRGECVLGCAACSKLSQSLPNSKHGVLRSDCQVASGDPMENASHGFPSPRGGL